MIGLPPVQGAINTQPGEIRFFLNADLVQEKGVSYIGIDTETCDDTAIAKD